MSLADSIKPISYFKANAAEVLEKLAQTCEPLIITQNGEAKAVVQDIASGRYRPAREVIEELRAKWKSR